MALTHLQPRAHLAQFVSGEMRDVGFVPFSWGGRGPFSFYNTYLWIVNANAEPEVREFIWSFLDDYVGPQRSYELDVRHQEEGLINTYTNSFIDVPARLPEDPQYEATRGELFAVAEREIPTHIRAFDEFLRVVHRVLFDADANIEREYDFYYASVMRNVEYGDEI